MIYAIHNMILKSPRPPLNSNNNPMKIDAVKDITTNRVFILGPAVSLNGSPTISPVIDAL